VVAESTAELAVAADLAGVVAKILLERLIRAVAAVLRGQATAMGATAAPAS
jgi:hypothetical protein